MPARVPTTWAYVVIAVITAGCAAAPPAAVDPGTASVASAPPAPVAASPGAAASLVSPDVLAAWPLDADGTGRPGPTLTLTGGARVIDGGMVLDGLAGYASTAGAGPVDTTRSFTVVAWGSLDRVQPYATAVSQVGETAAAFYLGRGESGWAFSMKDADTSAPGHTTRAQAPATTPATRAWTHLAGVFDEAASELRLYVDGALAATTPFFAPWPAGGELRVGAAQSHAQLADAWPGALRGVAVYQDALDAEAVAAIRAATRPAGSPAAWADEETVPAALRGTWDSVLSASELERLVTLFGPEEASKHGIPGAETRIRLGFDGTRWWLGFVFDGRLWLENGIPEGDRGVMSVTGDTMQQTNGRDGWATYRWRIDGDTLTLTLDSCLKAGAECPDIDVVRFMTERTYTRSGADPSY